MISHMIRTLLSAALISLAPLVFSQSDCSNALPDAYSKYQTGEINRAVEILKNCIHDFKNTDQRVHAHRILGMCYLEMNDPEKAEKEIRAILELRPNYLKTPNQDPRFLKSAMSDFKVESSWHLGVSLYSGIHTVSVQKNFSAVDGKSFYYPFGGYGLGVQAIYYTQRPWTIRTSLGVFNTGIRQEMETQASIKTFYDRINSAFVSLSPQHVLMSDKNITLGLGPDLGFDWIYNSSIDFSNENFSTGLINQSTKDGIDMKKSFQPRIGLRTSLDIHVKQGVIGVSLGFNQYLTKLNEPDRRLDDESFIFNTQYVNDDVIRRSCSFGLSYRAPIAYRIKH